MSNSGDNLYFDLRVDFPARQIAVSGEFDAATAGCLSTAVAKFQRSSVSDLTIDLADVTRIDSAGVGALSRARSAMKTRGGRVAFSGGSETLRRMLDVMDLSADLSDPLCA